jgi:hypothetical protein
VDETGARYRYADDGTVPPGAHHVPMVFPFSFDVHDKRAVFPILAQEYLME